jgi:ABC-type Fe3+/spermidine/putrescine transport system ATPase subunit
MSNVSLRGVSRRYADTTVVDALDLDVAQGEFLTLLGPSGCGKTTTLRMIAGFVRPTAGRICIGSEDVTDLEPRQRGIGMVFQDYALFPHLTVAENVGFGLVERGVARAAVARRVSELLELIRLPELGGRLPSQLSGGQQQRVALARAIAHPPRVLLLDEPLGALDLKMREHMQLEVRRIQKALGLTAVYVTHDQIEAMTMSDRVAVMNGGRIEQVDSPEAVYADPRTRFVAGFIGKVNLLVGRVTRADLDCTIVETPIGLVQVVARAGSRRPGAGAAATVAIRPEHLCLSVAGKSCRTVNRVTAHIDSSIFVGNVRHYTVSAGGAVTLLVETAASERALEPGTAVEVAWDARHAVLIDDSLPPQPAGDV